eukprot:760923-Hanusia_phi.AAC.1
MGEQETERAAKRRDSRSVSHSITSGMDATDAFEDIGHSKAARDQLKKYEIGDYKSDGAAPKKKSKGGSAADADGGSGGITKILVPVLVMAVIAFLVQKFM